MREGWKPETLGSVCQIKPPKKEAKQKLADSDPVSFVPMNDLGQRQKDLALNEERPLNKVVGSYTYFADNDVLLAKITPCFENGKLGIARNLTNGVGFGSSEYIVFRSTGDIDPEYLFYFLSQDSFRDAGARVMTGAVGHKRVSKEFIENYPIPVPSILEQKRIVAILDEAFEGIGQAVSNAEKNLANALELFKSVLDASVAGNLSNEWRSNSPLEDGAQHDLADVQKEVARMERKAPRKTEETVGHEDLIEAIPTGWQTTIIDSLFNLIDYRGKNPPKSECGKRLITAKNIRMGYIDDDPMTYVSEDTYRKWMVRGFPKPGDIFFVTEGHTMGFVAFNDRSDEFALAQRTITLHPVAPVPTKFFFYYMMSSYFQILVKRNATGAAAVGMKAAKLRTLSLPFPCFAEQKYILEKLDNICRETKQLEAIYQQKLDALAELKQSILQKAFAGELTAEPETTIKEEAAA